MWHRIASLQRGKSGRLQKLLREDRRRPAASPHRCGTAKPANGSYAWLYWLGVDGAAADGLVCAGSGVRARQAATMASVACSSAGLSKALTWVNAAAGFLVAAARGECQPFVGLGRSFGTPGRSDRARQLNWLSASPKSGAWANHLAAARSRSGRRSPQHGQIVHGLDVALLGGAGVPHPRPLGIGGSAQTALVQRRKPVLREGQSMRGGAPIPLKSLLQVAATPWPAAKRVATSTWAAGSPRIAACRSEAGPMVMGSDISAGDTPRPGSRVCPSGWRP